MEQKQRFYDEGKYLSQFSRICWVRCPRCAHRARVERGAYYSTPLASLSCGFCGLARRHEDPYARWHGPVITTVQRNCSYCGRFLSREQRLNTPPQRSAMQLTCPGCRRTSSYPLQWHPIWEGEPVDPAFGYPLWLQAAYEDHVLWAYNEEHLTFLKKYVAATLREREPRRNASLASRLPRWIKEAKNRATILRGLERLEQLSQEDRPR